MNTLGRKILSCFLAAAVAVGAVPFEFNITLTDVQAEDLTEQAKNVSLYEDNYIVDSKVIPNRDLLSALRQIIGGSSEANITFGELKNYGGDINLSEYKGITDVRGIGYAINAKSFDLSGLTGLTVIPNYEFSLCKMTEIKFPNTIEEIGYEAFKDCDKLVDADIPSSVKVIGRQAFLNCSVLSSCNIPKDIVKVGDQAFANCAGIQSVVIPDGIDATVSNSENEALNGLGSDVFAGCTGLKSVELGNGMTIIPSGFLQGTKALENIKIPSKVSSIRDSAFSGSGIQAIDLSANKGMTMINNNVFAYCESLGSVSLPDTITKIGANAFAGAGISDTHFLDKLTGLTEISDNAFKLSKIESATIPGNVSTIGTGAFSYCDSLTDVVISDYTYEVKEKKVKTIGIEAFKSCENLESVELPTKNEKNDNVELIISNRAFEKCRHLDNLYFPLNLKSIGDYAFTECAVTELLEVANAAKKAVFKKGAVYSEEEAPENATLVYGYTMADERFVQPCEFYVDMSMTAESDYPGDTMEVYYTDTENPGLNKYKLVLQEVYGLSNIDLSKNEGIELGVGAFSGCANVKTASLPDSMTEIPEYLFGDSYVDKYDGGGNKMSKSKLHAADWYFGLETINMSDGVTNIGAKAFINCKQLNIQNALPGKLQVIATSAFSGCEHIGKIKLPASLEYIGDSAFAGCSRMVDQLMVESLGLTECDATGAGKLEYIGAGAFSATSLKQFIMNKSAKVTRIQKNTFYNAQYLTHLSVSDSVGYIGNAALAACFKMNMLDIPDICTLDTNLCYGSIGAFLGAPADPDILYYVYNDKYYYYTNRFVISILPTQDKVIVPENSSVLLPLNTMDIKNANSVFEDIKIGDKIYKWNRNDQAFTGIEESVNVSAQREEASNVMKATRYDQKDYVVPIYGMSMKGIKSKENIQVVVQESLVFKVHDNCNDDLRMSPSVQYIVDVTKNPCKDIVTDNNVYVAINSSTAKGITPEFIPTYTTGDITDIISWKIVSGTDLITLQTEDDGKTAKILSKNSGYGTAVVRVTAGSVSKDINVYLCAPASSIKLSQTKAGMLLGNNLEATATLTYSSAMAEAAKGHPDVVVFSSSDEMVAQVVDVSVDGATTKFTVKSLMPGTAVITATASASGRKATMNVTVGASDSKITVLDSDNKKVEDGAKAVLRNKAPLQYTYNFDDSPIESNAAYVFSDDSVATASINVSKKTITVTGKKRGTTVLTVYPTVGEPGVNGININVNVEADIDNVATAKKIINEGEDDNVIYSVRNVFGEEISGDIESKLSAITDNTLRFTSSNTGMVTVDNYGNIHAVRESGGKSVIITYEVLRGTDVIKSGQTEVVVNKTGTPQVTQQQTTANGDAGGFEPQMPTGVSVVAASEDSIYVYADVVENPHVIYVYVDGKLKKTFQGGVCEINQLEKGSHYVQLQGVVNGKHTELSEKYYVEVGKVPESSEALSEHTTTEQAATEKNTTENSTTQKPDESKPETQNPATQKPTTAKPVVTVKPTVKPTTAKPTTAKPTTTKKISVPKAVIKRVVRTKDNKKLKITVKKIPKVTKYQIQYSTTKGFKKGKTKTVLSKKPTVTVKKLKANKVYYVRVRAYRLVNKSKKYGKWSKAKKIKVNKKKKK